MGDIIINNYYVLILGLIVAAIFIWELQSFIRTKNKVIIKAKVPSQNIMFIILAALFCYIILHNYGMYLDTYVLCALYVAAFGLAMLLRSGVMEDGIVIQGFIYKYSRLRYYNVDTETGLKPRVRFGLGLQEKFFEVEPDKIELLKAYMFKYKVLDFEEYVEIKKAQRKAKMEEAAKKTENAKKGRKK